MTSLSRPLDRQAQGDTSHMLDSPRLPSRRRYDHRQSQQSQQSSELFLSIPELFLSIPAARSISADEGHPVAIPHAIFILPRRVWHAVSWRQMRMRVGRKGPQRASGAHRPEGIGHMRIRISSVPLPDVGVALL
mmetsp:Transcript_25491/g.58027  ORF Transcript_25491/g.58027 Transcript_25491/m.58027 type:complete len:134 (-) Transcript_25491:86-487(-)